jgi:hypothetical protein
MSMLEQVISGLKDLLDNGEITEEEYQIMRKAQEDKSKNEAWL